MAMLWIRLSHGFKHVDDPELPEHGCRCGLHLKAYGTLEAVQNAIWGEDRPWIKDPALPLKGAKDASAGAANGLGHSAEAIARALRSLSGW